MPLPRELQLVVVTPETTVLDVPVSGLRLPLYDGQIGILPGRAPLVGRLGYGELKYTPTDGREESLFVDGGFVQVNGPVVSVLTNRALSTDAISAREAEEQLTRAVALVPRTELEFQAKDRDQERARRMLALARRSR
ncbi:MAG TPA: F0F1 ATP synthase subunit epsilon [Planctomycetaceae bacterium]|nr:F0F1 ATP synthase subunit epsilon [Planctomycetaceae bacterium]